MYDPTRQAIGLAEELIRWAGVLGIVGLLLIIPGWALFGWLWHGWEKLSWAEKLGLSAGFSLPFYFLLLLYTDWVGVHLGAGYAWGAVILGLAGLIWRGLRRNRLRGWWVTLKQAIKQPGRALPDRLPEIVLLILIGLILLTRWWAIREIEAPMWGDAVQHTFIAQLILDQGWAVPIVGALCPLWQLWQPIWFSGCRGAAGMDQWDGCAPGCSMDGTGGKFTGNPGAVPPGFAHSQGKPVGRGGGDTGCRAVV